MTGPRVAIVGVGQRLAGDDGVGPAVIDRLRASRLPADIVLREVREPSALVPMLHEVGGTLVIVDAVLAEPPGQVRALDPASIERAPPGAAFCHGLSVGQALALAAATRSTEGAPPEVRIVAVNVAQPIRGASGLSPAVAASVDEAAGLAVTLATRAGDRREREP
jgi:hydrogenase maturation protease